MLCAVVGPRLRVLEAAVRHRLWWRRTGLVCVRVVCVHQRVGDGGWVCAVHDARGHDVRSAVPLAARDVCVRRVRVCNGVVGTCVQLLDVPVREQLQRARELRLRELRLRRWVERRLLRLRRCAGVPGQRCVARLLWARNVRLRVVPVQPWVERGKLHVQDDGMPNDDCDAMLGARELRLRELRLHAAVDRTGVLVRRVAAVPGQLHVPAGSVRVWGVRLRGELWRPGL